MLESTSRSTPPPIPSSIAEHAKPSSNFTEHSAPFRVHHSLEIPNLSISEWTGRLLKFEVAAILTAVILAFPLLVLSVIAIGIAALLKN